MAMTNIVRGQICTSPSRASWCCLKLKGLLLISNFLLRTFQVKDKCDHDTEFVQKTTPRQMKLPMVRLFAHMDLIGSIA
jgi:hypothetical protein